jgi:hypothetical protein
VPAKNINEIEYYLSKVIEYENIIEPLPWMNNMLQILQQAYNNNYDYSIHDFSDSIPPYINTYYISNADTSIYYGDKDTIISRINIQGAAVVCFWGHGYFDFFISPEYFSIGDVNEMDNISKYFVSMLLPIQGPIMDTSTSITNEMLFLHDAGSLAGFAPVGVTYWQATMTIITLLLRDIFSDNPVALGRLLSLTELGGGTYYYIKKSLNLWGDPSIILNYSTVTSVDNDITTVPNEFSLRQNYPNPFNPSTRISWQSPVSSHQSIKVFDILGNEIRTLVDEYKSTGTYEVEFNASGLSSGVYFYKLTSGNYSKTMKMMLVR